MICFSFSDHFLGKDFKKMVPSKSSAPDLEISTQLTESQLNPLVPGIPKKSSVCLDISRK